MNDSYRHRWVVKVGSALLSDPSSGLDRKVISALAHDVAALQESGVDVVLVSSGSIAEGIQRLGWTERPRELQRLQAAAAGEGQGEGQAPSTQGVSKARRLSRRGGVKRTSCLIYDSWGERTVANRSGLMYLRDLQIFQQK